MPYFKVDELIQLSFSGNLAYELPESTKKMLIELESLLEITDAVGTDATERKEHKYDSRRGSTNEFTTVKYRNRYDFESSAAPQSSATTHSGRGSEKDKKKRDFRQKDGGGLLPRENPEVDKEWEMMRSFKATKIETKTGIEKVVNDLRISLNKISTANYEKQRDAIMALVNGYFDNVEEQTEANTRRISKAIFDIASTNKFYSEIYAKLYSELVNSHTIFAEMLEELIDGFIAMDTIPVYIDPDTDYDGFCAYSKACDIRKSTSTFIVNCLKYELVQSSRVSDILFEFVNYVDNKRHNDGFAKCVEEVIENIYIIATLCKTELAKTAKWTENILPSIQRFVDDKNKGLPSMSNRAVFKLLDLLEKL